MCYAIAGFYIASVLNSRLSNIRLFEPISGHYVHKVNSNARALEIDSDCEELVLDWNYENCSNGFLTFEHLEQFGWSVVLLDGDIKNTIQASDDQQLYLHLAPSFFERDCYDDYYGVLLCNKKLADFLNSHPDDVVRPIYHLLSLDCFCFGYLSYWTSLFNLELFSCPLNHADVWNKGSYLLTEKGFYYSVVQYADDGVDFHFISPDTFLIACAIDEYMDEIEKKEGSTCGKD